MRTRNFSREHEKVSREHEKISCVHEILSGVHEKCLVCMMTTEKENCGLSPSQIVGIPSNYMQHLFVNSLQTKIRVQRYN